jgi:hypothetical protein
LGPIATLISLGQVRSLFLLQYSNTIDISGKRKEKQTYVHIFFWHDLMFINNLQVLETARQVGRLSVSTTSDMPFREMAGHCETLTAGKQEKMAALMNSHQQSELLITWTTDVKSELQLVPRNRLLFLFA